MWPFLLKKDVDHLGIDIGTTSIKIVKISKVKPLSSGQDAASPRGKLVNYGVLRAYGYLEAKPSQLIHQEGVTILESEVARMLQALLAELKGDTKEVIMSIPAFSSFVDEIELPHMPESEIAQAIAFEARSHVPIPITDVELTWQITGEGPKGTRVNILAVPKEIIFRYQNICSQLNLTLKALEVETFSIVRALDLRAEEPVLVIDIGARNTNISLIAKGVLLSSYNLETAGRDLARVIGQGLGVSLMRAEELKKDQGLLLARANPPIARLLYPVIDRIVEAAKRVVETKGVQRSIKRVILTGGSATLKGLVEYLQEKLELSIDIAYPWATIEHDPNLVKALKANAPSFAVAVGLGLY